MRFARVVSLFSGLVLFLLACTTTYVEFEGECVMQEWSFLGQTMRERQICDLPSPKAHETQVRDREAMNVNPFPDLFENNKADSMDPNLLEKEMGVSQDEATNE